MHQSNKYCFYSYCFLLYLLLVKSYFPKLKANELKKILIESGIEVNSEIRINSEIEKEFGEISKSGKIVNLYNALIYASKKQYKK